MAKITIGGEDYSIPEMNFAALERAWPFIQQAMVLTSTDPLASPIAALRIIASALVEDESFQPQRYQVTATPDDPDKVHTQVVDFFRKKLKAREMVNLKPCVDQMLVDAGLTQAEDNNSGEQETVKEEASHSPGTVLSSSPNS